MSGDPPSRTRSGITVVALLVGLGLAAATHRDSLAGSNSIVADASPEPLYAVPASRDHAGRIAVPVMIDGQGPFRFLLDTGANRSAITSAFAARLGLEVSAEGNMIVNSVNGRILARTATVANMHLGSIAIGPQRLPVLDGKVFEGLDGSLGADLLANLRLTADFLNDRVTITQSGRTPHDPRLNYGIVAAHRVSGWLLEASGRARSSPFRMILDTGATHTLGNRALYRALTGRQLEDSSATHVDVIDATRTPSNGLAITVSPIVLGDLIIENTYVTFGDFAVFELWGMQRRPVLLLGMDVLGAMQELVLDYGRQEIQAMPYRRLVPPKW